MKILDLSLTYKWYDMIASGEKKEEYRELKNYWVKRFIDIKATELHEQEILNDLHRQFREYIIVHILYNEILKRFPRERYDAIRFHRGQGGKQIMLIECKGISFGYGNPEWGAPVGREVFIIKLGNKINV